MKRQLFLFLFFIVICSDTVVFGQAGYLGKRFHFSFDTRLSPAWSAPNFNGEQGLFKFNYHLTPSVEYVLNRKWVLGVNYQFYRTKFEQQDDIYGSRYRLVNKLGSVHVNSIGVLGKVYMNNFAPLGYYIKFQLDYIMFNLSEKVTDNWGYIVANNPKIDIYENSDWMLGFRIEMGKTFFIGEYFSLNTGISFGQTSKGNLGFKQIIERGEAVFTPSDYAANRILRSYNFGIHLSLGILPF